MEQPERETKYSETVSEILEEGKTLIENLAQCEQKISHLQTAESQARDHQLEANRRLSEIESKIEKGVNLHPDAYAKLLDDSAKARGQIRAANEQQKAIRARLDEAKLECENSIKAIQMRFGNVGLSSKLVYECEAQIADLLEPVLAEYEAFKKAAQDLIVATGTSYINIAEPAIHQRYPEKREMLEKLISRERWFI